MQTRNVLKAALIAKDYEALAYLTGRKLTPWGKVQLGKDGNLYMPILMRSPRSEAEHEQVEAEANRYHALTERLGIPGRFLVITKADPAQ